MKQQPSSLLREHYFYVSIAKFLFYHSEYGIVSVRDSIMLKDAERYGLSPLILYGLSVAGLPVRWMTYTPADKPRAFRDILVEAWNNAKGLRGRPDILWINIHIAKSTPTLMQDMKNIDVDVRVVDTKNKSLPASLRSAQDSGRWLFKTHSSIDKSIAESIKALCLDAQYAHDYFITSDHRSVRSRKQEEKIQQWLSIPVQKPITIAPGELDWEPGPWLSSWESSVPPTTSHHFNFDGFGKRTWLLTGEDVLEKIDEDNFWEDRSCDNIAEIAKNLVACWPNPPVEIAKNAGTTLKELRWFISGKSALARPAQDALDDIFSIAYDGSICSYLGTGPYVLLAKKPQALKEVYLSISNGGDAAPCEIVPFQGAADPSWRYILINTYGKPPSIVMSPRGVGITERFPDLLMNYTGIVPVSEDFYRDVVSTCARACRKPAANTMAIDRK
ncbi:MAG: hypothetical protein AB7D57_12565, partial [Desulfovibrionaceae bacterium]